MAKDIEELRFVADLAHNGGVMQAQNEVLQKENARLQADNARLTADIARLQAIIEQYQQNCSQPTVVVNQYFMLSIPKTSEYVSELDNNGRRFVCHFMHNTMPDGTPMSVIAQVDEMTRLEGSPEARLTHAMEDLAQRPTTQNVYGDKNDFQSGAEMLKVGIPQDSDPAEIAQRLIEKRNHG